VSIAERYGAYRIRAGEAYRDVWAWVPSRDGDLTQPGLEALAAARELAEASNDAYVDTEDEAATRDEAVAFALGDDAPRLGAACLERGADTAYVTDAPGFAAFHPDRHAGALEDAIAHAHDEAAGPRAVLFPDTPDGRDLASVAASRLDAGLVTGAEAVRVDDVTLQDAVKTGPDERTFERVVHATREDADGHTSTLAVLDNEARDLHPACVTLASGTVAPLERDPQRAQQGRILHVPVDPDPRDERVDVVEAPPRDEAGLEDADRVVCLGRGCAPDVEAGLEAGRELAEAIGARLGVTRGLATAARDLDAPLAELAGPDRQIGQAGRPVDADVYVAAGVSGAPRHLDAVRASCLVAVNPDPEAEIRDRADRVLEADLHEALPRLAEAAEDARGGSA
jgi:electron transfer flavoprotein alpha subunit